MTITEKKAVEPERSISIQRTRVPRGVPFQAKRGATMQPHRSKTEVPGGKTIQFSGTPSKLNIEFFKGKFAGKIVQLKGERLADGKFWAHDETPFLMLSPEKRQLTNVERAQVVAEIKKFTGRIEFKHNLIRQDTPTGVRWVKTQ